MAEFWMYWMSLNGSLKNKNSFMVCEFHLSVSKHTHTHGGAPKRQQGCLFPEWHPAVYGSAWNKILSHLSNKAANELLSSPGSKCSSSTSWSPPFIRLQPATCQVALVVQVSRGLAHSCSSWFLIYYVNDNVTKLWGRNFKMAIGAVFRGRWSVQDAVAGLPPRDMISNPTSSYTCVVF